MKNRKQANINITLKGLFRQWMEITKPFHKLAKQPQEILALFLYYHYLYRKDITNDAILWKIVFDYDTKIKIKEELGISDQVLQNNLTLLRRKNIINKNVITPLFVPELEQGSNNFKVIFNFNIINEK